MQPISNVDDGINALKNMAFWRPGCRIFPAIAACAHHNFLTL
jgi:hypothetical protein